MNVRFFLLMVVGMTTTVIPSEAGRPTRNLCFYPDLRIDIIPNPFIPTTTHPKNIYQKNPGLKSAGIFHFTERLYFNVKVAVERISVEEDPIYTVNLPGSNTHSWRVSSKYFKSSGVIVNVMFFSSPGAKAIFSNAFNSFKGRGNEDLLSPI